MKKLTLLSAIFAASMAQAEVSYNIAAASDYIWRGDTQTAHNSAVSGGVDYASESGLAAGIWISNVAGGQETDYYGSYTLETGAVALTGGVIHYDYIGDAADFTEVFVGASVAGIDLTYYSTQASYNAEDEKYEQQSGNDYLSVGYGVDLAEDVSLGLGAGYIYSEDDANEKYDVIASLTKSTPEFDFTLSWTKKEDAETGFQVGVSKGF